MAAGFLRNSMRTGGPQAGAIRYAAFTLWGSIERAVSDTLAIGQSISARAWEAFDKSHRSGIPVRQITLVTVVATGGLLGAIGLCRLCRSWRETRIHSGLLTARRREQKGGKDGIAGTIRTV